MVRYLILLLIVLYVLIRMAVWNLGNTARETYFQNAAKAPYDAIVVPGYPLDTAAIDRLVKVRIHWAKTLYERGIAQHIIFSGAAVRSPFVEGVYMRILADSLGLPAHCLFAETQARHSNENVIYGFRLAKALGFRKVAVATDPFQFSFLRYLVFQQGVDFLPFPPDSMKAYELPLPSADFSAAYVNDFIPLNPR